MAALRRIVVVLFVVSANMRLRHGHVVQTVDPSTIPAPADPARLTPAEYDNIERRWRDPALNKLSCGTGRAGFRDLVRQTEFLFDTDWRFVLLLTKYRAAFQGYAPEYRDVIISYAMQPNILLLPAILAHEIGHTVRACDEYGPRCSILQLCGFNHTPNANCEVSNLATADCLMKNNAASVCFATRGHFGWGDQDLDGVLDPFDPDFISL
jgi:hypothetical protein